MLGTKSIFKQSWRACCGVKGYYLKDTMTLPEYQCRLVKLFYFHLFTCIPVQLQQTCCICIMSCYHKSNCFFSDLSICQSLSIFILVKVVLHALITLYSMSLIPQQKAKYLGDLDIAFQLAILVKSTNQNTVTYRIVIVKGIYITFNSSSLLFSITLSAYLCIISQQCRNLRPSADLKYIQSKIKNGLLRPQKEMSHTHTYAYV